jgi:glycosyltransferase involved in cell wall biosynthesis
VLVHTNKMFEYMALGRPVIASRLDSVAAYLPPDALTFFEPGDPADLAEKLVWTAQHRDDLMRRVQNAITVYDKLRWDKEKLHYLAGYLPR